MKYIYALHIQPNQIIPLKFVKLFVVSHLHSAFTNWICEFQHFTWPDIYDGFIIFINPSVLACFTQATPLRTARSPHFPIQRQTQEKKTDYKIVL